MREAATSEVLFDGFVLSKVLDLVMAVSWCVLNQLLCICLCIYLSCPCVES